MNFSNDEDDSTIQLTEPTGCSAVPLMDRICNGMLWKNNHRDYGEHLDSFGTMSYEESTLESTSLANDSLIMSEARDLQEDNVKVQENKRTDIPSIHPNAQNTTDEPSISSETKEIKTEEGKDSGFFHFLMVDGFLDSSKKVLLLPPSKQTIEKKVESPSNEAIIIPKEDKTPKEHDEMPENDFIKQKEEYATATDITLEEGTPNEQQKVDVSNIEQDGEDIVEQILSMKSISSDAGDKYFVPEEKEVLDEPSSLLETSKDVTTNNVPSIKTIDLADLANPMATHHHSDSQKANGMAVQKSTIVSASDAYPAKNRRQTAMQRRRNSEPIGPTVISREIETSETMSIASSNSTKVKSKSMMVKLLGRFKRGTRKQHRSNIPLHATKTKTVQAHGTQEKSEAIVKAPTSIANTEEQVNDDTNSLQQSPNDSIIEPIVCSETKDDSDDDNDDNTPRDGGGEREGGSYQQIEDKSYNATRTSIDSNAVTVAVASEEEEEEEDDDAISYSDCVPKMSLKAPNAWIKKNDNTKKREIMTDDPVALELLSLTFDTQGSWLEEYRSRSKTNSAARE